MIPNGTYPVHNPIALALGAAPLTPEESSSYTVGAVIVPIDAVSITLDFYNITIEDRLALQNNTIGAADLARLIAAGIPNAALLSGSSANYFVNGFESEISGIDLAINSELGEMFSLDFHHNINKQKVSNIATNPLNRSPVINASRKFDLENQVPKQRTAITFGVDTGSLFDGLIRMNRYGSGKSTGGLFSPGDASDASSYGSEILFDLELNFTLADKYILSVGGENIFDVEPDLEKDGTLNFLGVTNSLTSPFGFNGAFFYIRASASF